MEDDMGSHEASTHNFIQKIVHASVILSLDVPLF